MDPTAGSPASDLIAGTCRSL